MQDSSLGHNKKVNKGKVAKGKTTSRLECNFDNAIIKKCSHEC